MGLVLMGFLIGYVIITLVILIIVVKLVPIRKWKWISGVLVVLISILIPTWDIPIGRINFHRLCETQAGQFIYKQVPLGEEYYLKPGERDLRYQENSKLAYAKGSELNLEKIEQDYVIDRDYDKEFSRWGNINKRETTISTQLVKQVLSRSISFEYGGGWLVHSIAGGTSKVCPADGKLGRNRPYTIHTNLPDMTFKMMSKNGDTP